MKILLDQYSSVVRDAIQNPSANMGVTLALLAIAVALVLLFAIAALLLLTPRQRKVKKIVRRWVPQPDGSVPHEAAPVARSESPVGSAQAGSARAKVAVANAKPPKRGAALLNAAVVPLLFAAAFVSAYAITGLDSTCADTCHGQSKAVANVHENDHQGKARCVSCHEGPQVIHFVGNSASRLRMVAVALKLRPATRNAVPVQQSSCLRCHDFDSEPKASTRVAVRMKHEEPLAAGANCFECHGDVGHLGKQARVAVSMNACISCHNGQRASAECDSCHLSEFKTLRAAADSGSLGSGRFSYPAVNARRRDCGGCHDLVQKCDPCHQTRMPHPQRFVDGYHAKDAAWEKKEFCWRCHEERDCQRCHAPFNTGHPETWRKGHGKLRWDSGCSCHARQKNQDIPICVFCHDNAPTMKVAPASPQ